MHSTGIVYCSHWQRWYWPRIKNASTVYPKKYAHGFCFAVLCCGYTLTDFLISIRLTSLALWQSNDCPSASKATLVNMDKYFTWIHYERLHNHNKAKHNKTVCIFPGIYCSRPFNRRCTDGMSQELCSWFALGFVLIWFGIGLFIHILLSHSSKTLVDICEDNMIMLILLIKSDLTKDQLCNMHLVHICWWLKKRITEQPSLSIRLSWQANIFGTKSLRNIYWLNWITRKHSLVRQLYVPLNQRISDAWIWNAIPQKFHDSTFSITGSLCKTSGCHIGYRTEVKCVSSAVRLNNH